MAWVGSKEIAKHLGISLRTLDTLKKKGLPFVTLPTGGKRFNTDHCDDYYLGLPKGGKMTVAQRELLDKTLDR